MSVLRSLYDRLQRQTDLFEQIDGSGLGRKWSESFGHPKAYKIFKLEKEEPEPPPVLFHFEPPRTPPPDEPKTLKRKRKPTPPQRLEPKPEPFTFVSGTIRSSDSGKVTSLSGLFEGPLPDLLSVTASARDAETGIELIAYFWFAGRIELSLEFKGFTEPTVAPIKGFAGRGVVIGGELSTLTLSGHSIVLTTGPYQHFVSRARVPVVRGINFVCSARLPATIGACFAEKQMAFDLGGLVAMVEDVPNPPLHLRSMPPARLVLGRSTSLTDCFVDIAVTRKPEANAQLRVALAGRVPALDPLCSPSGERWSMWSDVPAQGDLYAFRLNVPSTEPVLEDLALLQPFIPSTDSWLKVLPEQLRRAITGYRVTESTRIFNARRGELSSATLEIKVVNTVGYDLSRSDPRLGDGVKLTLTGLRLKWLVGLPESDNPQTQLEGSAAVNAFGVEMEGRLEFVSDFRITASIAGSGISSEWVSTVGKALKLARDPARSTVLTNVAEAIFSIDSKSVELILVDAEGSAETFAAPR